MIKKKTELGSSAVDLGRSCQILAPQRGARCPSQFSCFDSCVQPQVVEFPMEGIPLGAQDGSVGPSAQRILLRFTSLFTAPISRGFLAAIVQETVYNLTLANSEQTCVGDCFGAKQKSHKSLKSSKILISIHFLV
jgi:hypothetical protein